jgi:hypothetical protein
VEIEKPEWLNTGIEEQGKPASGFVNVFPNPSAGTFTFSFDKSPGQPVDITIYDMLGARVARIDQVFGNSFIWNPQSGGISLKPGFYFAKISAETHNEIVKLVIE